MTLTLADDHRALQDTVRRVLAQKAAPSRLRLLRDTRDPRGWSPSLWKELADLGILGVAVPTRWGGSEMGFSALCVLLEESGRFLCPEPLVSQLLLALPLLDILGDPLASSWIPPILAGEKLMALAWQERGTRNDFRRIKTSALWKEGRYHLNGVKTQVLDGHVADGFLVTALEESSLENSTPSLFFVSGDTPGVQRAQQYRIDGAGVGQIALEEVALPESARVAGPADTAALLEKVFDQAALGLAAEMCGGATEAFERTLSWLKERKQFGVPIGSFQALQHRAARLYIDLALARSTVRGGAQAMEEASPAASRLASLAKARASDTFLHVAEEAVQMHGGIGVTDECDIGLYLKRARAAEVTFGDSSWHRQRWAELQGY